MAADGLKKFSFRRLTEADVVTQRSDPLDPKIVQLVTPVVAAVKDSGEAGLLHYSIKFGDIKEGQQYIMSRDTELKEAFDNLPPDERGTLQRTAARIRAFAAAQRGSISEVTIPIPGGEAGQVIAPMERAGCYAPGGNYPLPSTVLMTVITARVAGCKEVWVASPKPVAATLAAAYVAGADALITIGGAQAVAAMAYGIPGKVPACDIVVGPGNKFVTAAKSVVSAHIAIDMLAGPSELLVIADDSADPSTVASDLLAQSEHDLSAQAVLVCLSEDMLDKVEAEVEQQLLCLPTADIARSSITTNGFAVVVADIEEAAKVADKIAPEHLELHTANADEDARLLHHYGGLFVGHHAAEVLGDYGAGPNHTLPTGGLARSTGGLSVFNFLRIRTWMKITDTEQSQQLVKDCVSLGRMEGLEGHARSAEQRLTNHNSTPPAPHKRLRPKL